MPIPLGAMITSGQGRPVLQDTSRRLRSKNADLVVAALTAIERMGDTRALPAVERLNGAASGVGATERVREAVRSCLAVLQAKAEQERARQVLLRPAEDNAANDVLLRPVQGTIESDPEVLLRPSGPESRT